MTEAAQKILEFARKYDVPFDEVDAELWAAHKAALARAPKDPEQLALAAHFRAALHFAKDEVTLADFIGDPQCPHDCKWCRAHDARAARRFSEHFRGIGK